jgi:hypothetical protein
LAAFAAVGFDEGRFAARFTMMMALTEYRWWKIHILPDL